MTRSISDALLAEMVQPQSGVLLLQFAEISHPSLALPIRVVSDVKDYVWGGETYSGVPFRLELLSDGERPPRGAITIQNVDRRIGEMARALATPPHLTITLLSSDDFDLTADPRTETGTATVEYQASHLRLKKIRADAIAVQAEIMSFDPSAEPWPQTRATKDRLPGLFR